MDDSEIIKSLGGPAKVARLLKFGKWGTNRVSNWVARGRIPAEIKLEFPHFFLARCNAQSVSIAEIVAQEDEADNT